MWKAKENSLYRAIKEKEKHQTEDQEMAEFHAIE